MREPQILQPQMKQPLMKQPQPHPKKDNMHQVKPAALRDKLNKKYSVDVPYDRVARGKLRALDMIYSKWDESYDLLPTYQTKLLRSVPGSVVELEIEEHNGDVCFLKFFVALKSCIDGFLQGCRPYIAMDATYLTGRV
jgi:hypothetical protein